MVTKALILYVEASTAEYVADMIEAVTRMACDIANSTDDESAHIVIVENVGDLPWK